VKGFAVALLASVLILAAGAGAAPNPHLIRADHSLGPLRVGHATLADARAAYGSPTRVRRVRDVCRAYWRNEGLSMQLLAFGRNPCRFGTLVLATTIGRSWHTAVGLRVGDPVTRIPALYPHSALHTGAEVAGYWLVTRHACPDVGGGAYPGLLARRLHGHVAAFVVTAGVCD
jgi:hypothetical protein